MAKIATVVLVRETELVRELVGDQYKQIRYEKSIRPAIITGVNDDGTVDLYVIERSNMSGISLYNDLAEAEANDEHHAIAACLTDQAADQEPAPAKKTPGKAAVDAGAA